MVPNNETYVFFENDMPLKVTRANYYLEVKKINLEYFPLIEDFKIELYDTQSSLGYQMRFTSDSLGIVTTFPWWDHVDKSLLELQDFIPVGTSEKPYKAADEGWCVWIWKDGDFIYILEGDDPLTIEFPVWFKVDSITYMREWERLNELVSHENNVQ